MRDIQTFVGNPHGDVDAVRAALADDPTLANAAWDWGDGDWETAIGAASHMKRRDIAELLLQHGARMDIFTAAMLDEAELVRAMLALYPSEPIGQHGIPLRAHAGEQTLMLLGDG